MWRSTLASLAVGVVAVVLGIVLLVVDETKNAVTWLAIIALLVIGAALVISYFTPARRT